MMLFCPFNLQEIGEFLSVNPINPPLQGLRVEYRIHGSIPAFFFDILSFLSFIPSFLPSFLSSEIHVARYVTRHLDLTI